MNPILGISILIGHCYEILGLHSNMIQSNDKKYIFLRGCLFLSTPVRMHGGLICIAFCLSVCPVSLDQNMSLDQNLRQATRSWQLACFQV